MHNRQNENVVLLDCIENCIGKSACHASSDSIIIDILAAVKRTAIPHHATFLGWSLNGVDASPKNA